MAVVADFYTNIPGNRPQAHIIVRDDAYRDASPEEIERRKENARQIAWGILIRAEKRKEEALKAAQAE